MDLKIKAIIIAVILLIAGGVLTFLIVYRDKSDFGDAPMGQPTGYQSGAPQGNFSLAKARAIDQVWLGDKVDGESESRQNNKDEFDDGVSPQFNSCQTSKAYFVVHLAKASASKGKAYLNLFVDWNKDGKWGGKDECASEWAVQNAEIDLSQQEKDILVYEVEFPGGKYIIDEKSIGSLWYRGAVSLNEKLTQDDGSAKVASGEIEDYGPMSTADNTSDDPSYSVVCTPEVLYVEHGETDEVEIVQDWGAAKFQNIEWQNHVVAKNANRDMEINGSRIKYTGKPVHDLGTALQDFIEVRVNYPNNAASILQTCEVWVSHNGTKKINLGAAAAGASPTPSVTVTTGTGGQSTTQTSGTTSTPTSTSSPTSSPTSNSSPSPTPTQSVEPTFTGSYETGSAEDGSFYLNIMVTPTNLAGQSINGMKVDISSLPAQPYYFNTNLNLDGWGNADGKGELQGSEAVFSWSSPMRLGYKSIGTLHFAQVVALQVALPVMMLVNGLPVATIQINP